MKEEYDFKKGRRRAISPLPPGKTRITIRLDDDILEWFRDKWTLRAAAITRR